jgi:hypothetical protein
LKDELPAAALLLLKNEDMVALRVKGATVLGDSTVGASKSADLQKTDSCRTNGFFESFNKAGWPGTMKSLFLSKNPVFAS